MEAEPSSMVAEFNHLLWELRELGDGLTEALHKVKRNLLYRFNLRPISLSLSRRIAN
jgi:hypothetical protein